MSHEHGSHPRTPNPDDFTFVSPGDEEEADMSSVYTLEEPSYGYEGNVNGVEEGVVKHVGEYDEDSAGFLLPPYSSKRKAMAGNAANGPHSQPSSPVGTPFTERPNHPLRALTATNLVLNQLNGTDESLISSSPLKPSQLHQVLSIDDNIGELEKETTTAAIAEATTGITKRESWDSQGAATYVKKVVNDNGTSEELVIRKSVKDFKFGKTLGVGSYSTVLLATDKNTSNQFAVKVLDKRHIIREKKVKYVNIEKNTLNRLGVHNGIVRLFFTFQDESSLYFVLDYAPNGELLSLIKEFGTLNEDSTRYYGAQILDAIKYMHDNGVIHRDSKPENILVDKDMKIQITDFGTAKLLEKGDNGRYPSDARSKSFVGTAEYVSPELLNEKAVGKPCDIWAFGCIIYQMIAGKPPFKATNEYLTFQKIVKLQYAFTAGFPMVVRDLIKKILVLNPKDRATIKTIQNHFFFSDIDFNNPQESIWDAPPPEAGPYKVSAKSMLPVPELTTGTPKTKITIPRRTVSASTTPTASSETVISTESSTASSTAHAQRAPLQPTQSQQVLMKAKATVAARKQTQAKRSVSAYTGAASAAALALSRQPNEILKAYNEAKDAKIEKNHNEVMPSATTPSHAERIRAPSSASQATGSTATTTTTTTTSTVAAAAPAPVVKKRTPLQSAPVVKRASVPPMSKLDLEYVDYLKDSEERIIKVGELVVYMNTVEFFEKKYKRRLIDSPLGGNNRFTGHSLLSQVANGSYRGLRNMEQYGTDAEKDIITSHGEEEDPQQDTTKNKLRKFFTAGGEDDHKIRFVLVTSNARVLIFNKVETEGDDSAKNIELRTEIDMKYPVIKVKELLPSSANSDSLSLFVIESYNKAFGFEGKQTEVSSWTKALEEARQAVVDKATRRRFEQDPSGDAGTKFGSTAADNAARIAVGSPPLKASETFEPQPPSPVRNLESTSGHPAKHPSMLKELVARKTGKPIPTKGIPESKHLIHGLPLPKGIEHADDSTSAQNGNGQNSNSSISSTSKSRSHTGPRLITGLNSRLLARSSRKKRN